LRPTSPKTCKPSSAAGANMYRRDNFRDEFLEMRDEFLEMRDEFLEM
jgi:hypothetical protein